MGFLLGWHVESGIPSWSVVWSHPCCCLLCQPPPTHTHTHTHVKTKASKGHALPSPDLGEAATFTSSLQEFRLKLVGFRRPSRVMGKVNGGLGTPTTAKALAHFPCQAASLRPSFLICGRRGAVRRKQNNTWLAMAALKAHWVEWNHCSPHGLQRGRVCLWFFDFCFC